MVSQRTVAPLSAMISARVAGSPDCSIATLRPVRRQLSRELREEDPVAFTKAALRLVADHNVPRWFTYELVNHHPALALLTVEEVETLGRGIDNWGDVDAFGCYIAGPAFREDQLTLDDLRRWAASEDRWWRRAALVSTVPLNNTARGGRGDARRTLAVCDHLRHDRDDMVVKAMSWALRELAKKDPRRVEAYLNKHQEELAPRVLREVNNKLRTGLKNPRPQRSA